MKNYNNLDGEIVELDGVTNEDMSFHDWVNDSDDFYPFQGEALPMIAASAAQNTPDYFDQDNFYPADGDYSEARGRLKGTIFDKKERAKRRAERQKRINARQSAKNEEVKSRAELNRQAGKESQGDVELAKSLSAVAAAPIPGATDNTATASTSTGLSKNKKILIGVGVAVVLAVLGVVIYKRYKK